MCRCAVLAVALLTLARSANSLHCFSCTNITNGFDCDTVTACQNEESCYIERQDYGNQSLYSYGCIARQNCPDHHRFAIVGRSVSSQCKECCSQDGCGKRYCEVQEPNASKPTTVSCLDEPGQNCSGLSSLFNVCSDPHHAKDICRKFCGLCDMVDGQWGLWKSWSACSTTCGFGIEIRIRECNNPAPAHGGYTCPGNETQQRSCFDRPCPVHGQWRDWAPWERCSAECGPGLKKRHRTCTNPPPSYYGHFCIGDAVEYNVCQGNNCGNHTVLGITPPAATQCDNVLLDCAHINKTLGVCNNFEAARKTCAEFCGFCGIVDGGWANWVPWTTCSTSCGNGTKTRSRTCSNPPPQNGGKECIGNKTESSKCIVRECPVHGGWGLWAHWSQCSSSCGQGMTRRTRVCDNPRPDLLGNYCFGESADFGLCIIKPCPVNGGWTDWFMWGSCSLTCGQGHMARQRSCLNPRPANGGLNCPGPQTMQRACNVTHCPVNGAWNVWSSWSGCSSTCGPGLSHRHRSCNNPPPAFHGQGCIGDSSDTKLCNKKTCPGVQSYFTVTNPVAGKTTGTIRFTRIVTNIGGRYNTSSGKFTCQYPGLYFFILHILKQDGYHQADCYIRKNGVKMVFADTNVNSAGGYDAGSNSVTLHLAHGDTVDTGGCTDIHTFFPLWETSFSGFLVRED